MLDFHPWLSLSNEMIRGMMCDNACSVEEDFVFWLYLSRFSSRISLSGHAKTTTLLCRATFSSRTRM
jgi:hypothetical protein